MDNPFWNTGLQFECTRCSACCRHEPGLVLLSSSDIRRLMRYLGLEFKVFFSDYCRLVDTGQGRAISLLETSVYDCIFWKPDGGCSVYEARPVQCRTYPFWPGIADSRASWDRERSYCPGIGRPVHCSRSDIEEALWAYRGNRCVFLPPETEPETVDEDTVLGS